MKRNLLTLLVASASIFAFAGGLTSCSSNSGQAEYALVTDVGDIDDHSFNQAAWEAVKAYAEKNGKSYAYYRPTEDSTSARVTAIDLAISKGAKIVVCPGYLFEESIYQVQDTYKDVKFVLLDGEPHNPDYTTYKTSDNVCPILYTEQIAGYLAGYATVADGYTKLGFCGGMAVPAVQKFGYGYLQGAAAAAEAKNVSVNVKYYYAGAFAATDAATALMTSWYNAGTEVVFACGGKVYQSVVAGCGTTHKWIGVDVDQSSEGAEVLTSAMKGLGESVTSALESYDKGKWNTIGGKTWTLGLKTVFGEVAAKDYVGIPTADSSWRFANFTKANYETLISNIGNGSSILGVKDASGNDLAPADFATEKLTVDVVA